MASVARSLGRPAMFLARRGPIAIPSRSFSVSSGYLAKERRAPPPKSLRPQDYPPMPEYTPDLLTDEERSMYDMMVPEEQEKFDEENRRAVEEYNDLDKRAAAFAEIDKLANQVERDEPMRFRDEPVKRRGFWADGERDEMTLVEDGDDSFNDDEITSMAHTEVESHRELREYARITAWDMPLLSNLAKPFELPPQTHILRFRYTTYMGEQHPAEPKVVLELSTQDLTPTYLTEDQRRTFIKLVGPRYNPDKDIVKMSCEQFNNRAQNKRYLGDLVNSLIKEAKEGDSYADIPLDLRHHKPKTRTHFPKEWNMTELRKKQLEARRAGRKREEEARKATVDGNAVVVEAAKILPSLNPALAPKAASEKEKVAVKANPRAQGRRMR